jgi:hypothetical protein
VIEIGTAATRAKQRWNSEHYVQVKISVEPELARAFKKSCEDSNVSMAKELSGYMEEYTETVKNKVPERKYETKRQRRIAIKGIIQQIEEIKLAQELSRDKIPENLQNSSIYETADECVSMLEEALEQLGAIY